ncbi:MAG TPA: chemotaxis protein CheW [Magnetospirillaceae bacterium]|nr:chemotaxis protein CheW [Magnetospirillaceae bacterium]
MSRAPSKLSRQAAALKKAFDAGFSQPLRPAETGSLDLLAVRLAGEPWTILLSAIAGLYSGKKITPLPGGTPGLLGLAGFRGTLVPVYDLAARIGLAPVSAPRWLVLAKERRIALAFADLDGHLRAGADAIVPAPPGGNLFTGGFVNAGGESRPVLHLPAVLDGIPRRKDLSQEGTET